MTTTYDAIIIGGGHNGLVTAAYLARAGRSVLVLERRELLGGCAVTEELWPGFKVSTASYVNSLFRPEIIRDLELKRHGFQMLPRSPSSFTPFPDGRYLMMGPDKAMTHREISKFSKQDAEVYRIGSGPGLRTHGLDGLSSCSPVSLNGLKIQGQHDDNHVDQDPGKDPKPDLKRRQVMPDVMPGPPSQWQVKKGAGDRTGGVTECQDTRQQM